VFSLLLRQKANLNRWICVRMDIIGALFASGLAGYLVYGQANSALNTGFSVNMAGKFQRVKFSFDLFYAKLRQWASAA
jgi:hypothetical protein